MNDDRHIAAVTAQFLFVSLFSAEVTGLITKIIHHIVTLVVLLNHAYVRR